MLLFLYLNFDIGVKNLVCPPIYEDKVHLDLSILRPGFSGQRVSFSV